MKPSGYEHWPRSLFDDLGRDTLYSRLVLGLLLVG